MAEASKSTAWQIQIDGSPVSTAHLDCASVEVDSNLPDHCILTFREPDPAHGIFDQTHVKVGSTVEVTIAADGTTAPLFDGEVTAFEAEIDPSSTFQIIRAYDMSHRLHRGVNTKKWTQKAYSDAVKDIAGAHNMDGGQIDDTGGPVDEIVQFNKTDWDFLQYLAAATKYVFSTDGGKVNFIQPPDASGGGGSDTSPLTLDGRKDFKNPGCFLRVSVTSAEQPGQVEYRGYDPIQKQVQTSVSQPSTQVAQVPDDPSSLASAFGSPKHVVSSPMTDADEVKGAADSVASAFGSSSIEMSGTTQGNPALKPGATVTLTNVHDKFNTSWVLSSVRHRYVQGHYLTDITVSGARPRGLLSLMQ